MSDYIAISSYTTPSQTNSVTLSSIPSTKNGKNLRDLVLVIDAIGSGNSNIRLQFNGDTSASNYFARTMRANGTSYNTGTAATSVLLMTEYSYMTSSARNITIANIQDYTSNVHKSVIGRASTGNGGVESFGGRWAGNATITSVTILGNDFAAGSNFSLWAVAY